MADQRRRAFKPLRFRLSQIEDEAVRNQLENRFEEVQVQREIAVAAARKSAIADRERQIAQAQAEIAFVKLTQEASEHLPAVAREPVWAAYRDGNEVIFECPFSENDMRNAMKVQRSELGQRARQIEENGDEPYRGGGEDEDEPAQ